MCWPHCYHLMDSYVPLHPSGSTMKALLGAAVSAEYGQAASQYTNASIKKTLNTSSSKQLQKVLSDECLKKGFKSEVIPGIHMCSCCEDSHEDGDLRHRTSSCTVVNP